MSLLGSATSAGAAGLLVRGTGFLREVAFAAVFGSSLEADAFLAARRVPDLFRDLFAEGSFTQALVPVLADADARDPADMRALMRVVLGVVLLVTGLLSVLLAAAAPGAVYVVAAGFADVPGKMEVTTRLVRWLAPLLATTSAASVLAASLQVRGRFFAASAAPMALNLGVIAGCGLTLLPWSSASPLLVVAAAAGVGGLAQVLVQMPALQAAGLSALPAMGRHPKLRSVFSFFGPAVVAMATVQLGLLVDLQLAASLGDGPVARLNYAVRLVQLPMHLFAGALGVAALAQVSAAVAEGRPTRALASQAVGATLWTGVPAAVALIVFADPLVRLIYERGAFTPADTEETAALVRCFAVGGLGFCLHRVVVPLWFALKDPWTPAKLSVATLVVKLPLAVGGAYLLGVRGIALAHVAVLCLEVAVLLGLLRRVLR